MKRFLLILMSIIVLAVLGCGALVGCAGTDVPSDDESNKNTPSNPNVQEEYIEWSPQEFFDVWFASDNKSYYMPTLGITAKLHGNIFSSLYIQENIFQQIYEFEDDNINIYGGKGNLGDDKLTWDAKILTKDMVEESSDIKFNDIVGYFNAMMKYQEDWQEWWTFDKEYFNTLFERNSQGCYEGLGEAYGLEIRFTKNSFMIKSPGYPEFEYAEVFTIGCEEITIPNEAKDALQLEINKAKSPAEFLERWLAAENKTFYIQDGDGVGTLYENMFMMTDGKTTYSIYEYVDGKINHYTTTQNGWEAKVYTIKEIEEEMGIPFEGIQSLLIYFDYGKIEEILKITEEVFTANFEKDSDWHIGKGEYSKEKYKITGSELTVKYDYGYLTTQFDAKYVMGAEKIIIPDEAKEALKKALGQV